MVTSKAIPNKKNAPQQEGHVIIVVPSIENMYDKTLQIMLQTWFKTY